MTRTHLSSWASRSAAWVLLGGLAWHGLALADDLPQPQLNQLRQRLAKNMPELPPVDSAATTPVPGIIEIHLDKQVFYVDAKAEYLIKGQILETRTKRNLTEESESELTKTDFAALPVSKDAVVWRNGNGKRKLVVFADPNCGYCKRLEKDLQQIKDITVYTFIISILGDDSKVKATNIWCVKDRTQAWRDWMLNGVEPSRAFGMCSNPLQRNNALAHSLRIEGTPAMVFEDGTILPSAAPAAVIEQRLNRASAKVGR